MNRIVGTNQNTKFENYKGELDGQFFIQEAGGISNNYEIYHWTRYHIVRDNGSYLYPYFIIIEPEELVFYHYEYSEDSYIMNKNPFLTIPLIEVRSASFKVENELRNVLQYKNKETKISIEFFSRAYFRTNYNVNKKGGDNLFKMLLLDFLWDLNVNKYFDNNGKKYLITQALSRYPIISAISIKLEFYEFILGYSPFEFIVDKKNYEFVGYNGGKVLNNSDKEENNTPENDKYNFRQDYYSKQKNIYLEWITFLTQDQNEFLFVDKKLSPVSYHWLNTVEEEVQDALDAINTQNIEHNEEKLINRKVTKYLLKRYNLIGVLKYFSPLGYKTNWLYFSYILILFLGIIIDWIAFNLFSTSYSNSILIPYLIFIFTIIPIITLVFTGGAALTTKIKAKKTVRKKHKFSKLLDSIKAMLPEIFLPKLSLAIFSGWLIFFTSEDLIKVDFNISWQSIFIILLVVIFTALILMYNEIRNVAISLHFKKVILRIIYTTMLGFIISYTIGFWTMPFVTNKMMENNSVITNFYLNTELQSKIDTITGQVNNIDKYDFYIRDLSIQLLSFHSLSSLRVLDYSTFRVNEDDKRSIHNYKPFDFINTFNELKNIYSYISLELHSRDSIIARYDNQIKDPEIKQVIRKKILVYYDPSIGSDSLRVTDSILIEREMILEERINSINKRNFHLSLLKLDENWHCMTSKIIEKQNELLIKKSSLLNKISMLKDPKSIQKCFYKDSVHCYPHPLIPQNWTTINEGNIDTTMNVRGLKIFPNMLMFRAIMAFFIGVFLQLIIQDKSILESIT